MRLNIEKRKREQKNQRICWLADEKRRKEGNRSVAQSLSCSVSRCLVKEKKAEKKKNSRMNPFLPLILPSPP